jgi:hypothetical protein
MKSRTPISLQISARRLAERYICSHPDWSFLIKSYCWLLWSHGACHLPLVEFLVSIIMTKTSEDGNCYSSMTFCNCHRFSKNMVISGLSEMIHRFSYCGSIQKFISRSPQCCSDWECAICLSKVLTGELKQINIWTQIRDALNVKFTFSIDEWINFLYDYSPRRSFIARLIVNLSHGLIGGGNQS